MENLESLWWRIFRLFSSVRAVNMLCTMLTVKAQHVSVKQKQSTTKNCNNLVKDGRAGYTQEQNKYLELLFSSRTSAMQLSE